MRPPRSPSDRQGHPDGQGQVPGVRHQPQPHPGQGVAAPSRGPAPGRLASAGDLSWISRDIHLGPSLIHFAPGREILWKLVGCGAIGHRRMAGMLELTAPADPVVDPRGRGGSWPSTQAVRSGFAGRGRWAWTRAVAPGCRRRVRRAALDRPGPRHDAGRPDSGGAGGGAVGPRGATRAAAPCGRTAPTTGTAARDAPRTAGRCRTDRLPLASLPARLRRRATVVFDRRAPDGDALPPGGAVDQAYRPRGVAVGRRGTPAAPAVITSPETLAVDLTVLVAVGRRSTGWSPTTWCGWTSRTCWSARRRDAVVVGPLVLPGRTPCLSCTDLTAPTRPRLAYGWPSWGGRRCAARACSPARRGRGRRRPRRWPSWTAAGPPPAPRWICRGRRGTRLGPGPATPLRLVGRSARSARVPQRTVGSRTIARTDRDSLARSAFRRSARSPRCRWASPAGRHAGCGQAARRRAGRAGHRADAAAGGRAPVPRAR